MRQSLDDVPKEFDFMHFDKTMDQMKSENTSVGNIVGAMLYQIEKDQTKKSPN